MPSFDKKSTFGPKKELNFYLNIMFVKVHIRPVVKFGTTS